MVEVVLLKLLQALGPTMKGLVTPVNEQTLGPTMKGLVTAAVLLIMLARVNSVPLELVRLLALL